MTRAFGAANEEKLVNCFAVHHAFADATAKGPWDLGQTIGRAVIYEHHHANIAMTGNFYNNEAKPRQSQPAKWQLEEYPHQASG